jgi:hypothetical protein
VLTGCVAVVYWLPLLHLDFLHPHEPVPLVVLAEFTACVPLVILAAFTGCVPLVATTLVAPS